MADLDETIEEAAKNPKSVTVDGTKVDAQSIDDLIKADQHLAAKRASAAGRTGLRYRKLTPPGTTS